MQFRVIVVTDPQTHPQTHRQDRLQYTVPLSLARSVKKRPQRHKHCALAVVRRSQKFSPHCRPLSRGAGPPKCNQLEMVTTFTYRTSLVKIDARNFEFSSYRDNKPTNKPINTQTDRTDYNTLRR